MARSQAELLEELCQKFQKEAEELGAAISMNALRSLLTVPQMSQNPLEDAPNGPFLSGFRSKNEFERVAGDIPFDPFPYGKPEADWLQWSDQFVRAVKVATNAQGQERLDELCLLWLPLKLAEAAQPLYDRCEHKGTNWPLLHAELDIAFDDPATRRDWIRNMDAYKKPTKMSLQVYKANVTRLVNRYSPVVVKDEDAYAMELYNRFVHGLDLDCKEYIEDSIPYGEESLDNAYSQALKYEEKKQKRESKDDKKEAKGVAAALSQSKDDMLQSMRRKIDELSSQLDSLNRPEDGGSGSSASDGSSSDSEMPALQAAVEKAFAESLKGWKIGPKKHRK